MLLESIKYAVSTMEYCSWFILLLLISYPLQAGVFSMVDNAIDWINLYSVGSAISFLNFYPLDSDLSSG